MLGISPAERCSAAVLEYLFNSFVILFVVVDPIGVVPIFWGLTHGADDQQRRRMAIKGVSLAALILLVFYLAGDALLHSMGISVPAFRIAGGALLFMLAIDMVFARQSGLRSTTASEQAEVAGRDDISVFPLAFPLISGPGALTTVLLMAATRDPYTYTALLGVMALVLAITLAALLMSARFMRLLGQTGANVIDRLLGLILAALAVQFVIDGVRGAFLS